MSPLAWWHRCGLGVSSLSDWSLLRFPPCMYQQWCTHTCLNSNKASDVACKYRLDSKDKQIGLFSTSRTWRANGSTLTSLNICSRQPSVSWNGTERASSRVKMVCIDTQITGLIEAVFCSVFIYIIGSPVSRSCLWRLCPSASGTLLWLCLKWNGQSGLWNLLQDGGALVHLYCFVSTWSIKSACSASAVRMLSLC